MAHERVGIGRVSQALVKGSFEHGSMRSELPLARIIRAREWKAWVEQHQQREQARNHGVEIVQSSHQKALSIAEAARAKGYAEGQVLARRDHAAKIAAQALQATQVWASLEERMCIMVTQTLQAMLLEPENDRRFFEIAISRVLAAARQERVLLVRVSPDQAESAKTALASLLSEKPVPQFVDVVSDSTLKPGACVVESALGVIDASLHTQLDAIRQILIDACKASHG